MKRLQQGVAICMIVIGIYGSYWMLISLFGLIQYGSEGLFGLIVGIPFSLVGYIGINRLRGKFTMSVMEFIILLWGVNAFIATIMSTKNLVVGATLFDVYKSNIQSAVLQFIVVPVLFIDIILNMIGNKKS